MLTKIRKKLKVVAAVILVIAVASILLGANHIGQMALVTGGFMFGADYVVGYLAGLLNKLK